MELRINCRLYLALLKLLAVSIQVVVGADLRNIWEINLDANLNSSRQPRNVEKRTPVIALRFSPDGRQLAVVAGYIGSGRDSKSHLFVIQTHKPDAVAVRETLVSGGITDHPADSLSWSADARYVDAGGTVLEIASMHSCIVPDLSTFAFDNQIIATVQWAPRPTFAIFDGHCAQKDVWNPPYGGLIHDVAFEAHIVSIYARGFSGSIIVNPISRQVARRWKGVYGQFADNGKALCGGTAGQEEQARISVGCWDVATGQLIHEADHVNVGVPLMGAARASLVVASDYNRRRDLFSHEYRSTLKRNVVWDFRRNREIVSWKPEYQSYVYKGLTPPKRITEPFKFAISSDGQYIAEGGSGVVRLYRIE